MAWYFVFTVIGMVCFMASPFVISMLIDHPIAVGKADTVVWILVAVFIFIRFVDEWLWRVGEIIIRSFLPILFERTRSLLYENTLKKTHSFFCKRQ